MTDGMNPWHASWRSKTALSDQGPWTRYLPLMWASSADPEATFPLPEPSPGAVLDLKIAFWAPLTQLLPWHLGWRSGSAGLVAWDAAGWPTDSPALALPDHWCGPRLDRHARWPGRPDGLQPAGPRKPEAGDVPAGAVPRPADRREQGLYADFSEGVGEPLHLVGHADLPVEGPGPEGASWLRGRAAGDVPRAALLVDQYAGWYGTLCSGGAGLPEQEDGRSWRVEVVFRPLGHPGVYRRSRDTGRWFAGRHRDHLLGT